MGTGPDRINLECKSATLLCDRDAHRKVKAIFCLLFVGACTKSEASGGTRPAGLDLSFLIVKPFKPSRLALEEDVKLSMSWLQNRLTGPY
jgi:hypothetical protein